MKTPALIRQAIRSMDRYRLRSAFMMLGSLVGAAALTFVVSLAQGAEAKMLRTVKQVVGDGSVIVAGGGSRMMGGPHAAAGRLTIDDVAAAVQQVPGIEAWDPQAVVRETVRHADSTTEVRVIGGSEHWSRVWGRGVARGESFDRSAIEGSSRVALIGETVAHRIFGAENPIGGDIRIGAVPFRVIGVLEPFGVDMHGMDRDDEIVVPLSTLMRRVTNIDAIGAAKIVVADPRREDTVAASLRQALRARHRLDRDRPDDFSIMTSSQVQGMVSTIERVLWLYVPLVGGIVLIIGGGVAATLMLASVNERTAEIGLRTAIGARPADIRWQFIAETAATVVLGGLGGVVLGLAGVQLVALHLPLDSTVSWAAVAISVLASIVVGFAAGVAPAQRAARLNPVDALR